MPAEKPSTLARYLLVAATLLVVYASLYPFSGWRNQGLSPFAFLAAPLPRRVTAFDLVANVVGYVPVGFLAATAAWPRLRNGAALAAGVLWSLLLSFTMEALQQYLPSRIASNLDLLANAAGGTAGAALGALCARRLLRENGLHALRVRLFASGRITDLGLVLLALWLIAQLNPQTLLFGTGDLREFFRAPSGRLHSAEVFLRIEAGVACANLLAAGLIASALAGDDQPRRAVAMALAAAALLGRSLVFGLAAGPEEALAWVTPGAIYGIAAGLSLLLALVGLPRTALLALAAIALLAAVALVNLAPENPYSAIAVASLRQGQLFNFHALTRLVSAAWPFAAMIYLVLLAAERRTR